ncbi:hypothetical protein Q5752_001600 [Cryptotrichosporon argae]
MTAPPAPLSAYVSRRGVRFVVVALILISSVQLLNVQSPALAPTAWIGQRLRPYLEPEPDSLSRSPHLAHDAYLANPAQPVRFTHVEYADCDGWDPATTAAHDPPGCLRARQYRQIQAWYADPKWPHEAETYRAVRQLERCVLGLKVCPTRPLIASSWWYTFRGMRGGVSGEEYWMSEVVEAVQEDDFIIITDFRAARMNQLVKDLSELLHMYWMRDANAFECIQDPRCIRPEDYTPVDDPTIGYDLAALTEAGDIGVLPMHRIFAVSYWGARPVNAPAPGLNAAYDWGVVPQPGGDEVWSYNPLGRRWVITPFPYPDHTWIPYSAERECLQTPYIPFEERNSSVVILAKETKYFHYPVATDLLPAWPALADDLAALGHSFVSTSTISEGQPLPVGVEMVGRQARPAYQHLLAGAKALLGIGHPEISPSPYVALCKGTPVIMPYNRNVSSPTGWSKYNAHYVQHGPINELSEPYVYTYDIHNATDLRDKMIRAIQTPIEPYVPPEYDEKSVKVQTRKMLYYDYEGEYRRRVDANGGRPPALPTEQVQRCWERKHCFNTSYPDNVQH